MEFSRSFKSALCAVVLGALAACGGGGGDAPTVGGGGGTPAEIVTTYTAANLCASGPALSSNVSQAAANALVPSSCPVVPTTGVSVTVVGGMLTVSGLPAGVSVASSTVTAVSGASNVVFVNGQLTSGTLLSAATYTYSGAMVTFSNAPPVTLAGTFVSPTIAPKPVVCTAPAMLNSVSNACVSPPAATGYAWNSVVGGGVWVADIGVLVTGANLLPATSFVIGDAAWLTAAANGTIKYVKTSSTMTGLNDRPLIYAFYKTTNAPGGNGNTEYYAVTAMYADTVATSAFANQNVGNGSQANIITEVKGSVAGIKQNIPSFGTYQRAWDGANFANTQLGPVGSSI